MQFIANANVALRGYKTKRPSPEAASLSMRYRGLVPAPMSPARPAIVMSAAAAAHMAASMTMTAFGEDDGAIGAGNQRIRYRARHCRGGKASAPPRMRRRRSRSAVMLIFSSRQPRYRDKERMFRALESSV
jgi:hypothetical protein